MLVWGLLDPDRFDYPDTRRYIRVADNIAAGNGPMESADERCSSDPGYPALLAVGRLLGISSFNGIMTWGRFVNLVAGTTATVAAMRLARRAAGTPAALVAGLLMSLDPIFVFFHGLVLTDVVYTALMLWSIEWLLAARTGGPGAAIAAGVALGASTLTRSSGLLLPVFLLPILLGRDRARLAEAEDVDATIPPAAAARRAALAVMFLAAYSITLLPSTIRNYHLLRAFVPVRTGVGATLLDSFGDWADGGTGMERVVWPTFAPGADERERDLACRQAVWDWVRSHPKRAIELAVAKVRRTWALTLSAPGYRGSFFSVVSAATVAPIYVLAAVGLWRLRNRPRLLLACIAPAVYFTLVHSIFIGSVRYRIPAMPGLFVLAGTAVAALPRRPDARTALAEPSP